MTSSMSQLYFQASLLALHSAVSSSHSEDGHSTSKPLHTLSRGRALPPGGPGISEKTFSKGPQEKQSLWVFGPRGVTAPLLNPSLEMGVGFPLDQSGPPVELGLGPASGGVHGRRGEHLKQIGVLLGRRKCMLGGQPEQYPLHSLWCPQHLEQCLACKRLSINIYSINLFFYFSDPVIVFVSWEVNVYTLLIIIFFLYRF